VTSPSLIQGSSDWLQARCGRVTASRVADLMARTKSGWGASRANYMAELVCERLTGNPTECYVNAAMLHGTQQEPYARAAYAEHQGVEVHEVGFIEHPEIAMSGCSPDGFVGDDGLIEIKAPQSATHIETLLTSSIPEKYRLQMQFQMAVCGRAWCDFASFDPRLPEPMRLFVQRVHRDVSLILDLETEVAAFLREIDEKVAALTAKYQQQERAA
jgi:putative phage-type endonuclease